MKVTVKSPSNIAFIKYWGRKNALNLPFNDSMSMNLTGCITETSVEFRSELKEDEVSINDQKVTGNKRQKVVDFLGLVRDKAGITTRAVVESKTNFPIAVGIASSAAAFSALAMAASNAAGLKLSDKELSILARRGSGSACRSIFDGFGYWKKGNSDQTSYAHQLALVDHWDIVDIVAVVGQEEKKVSSFAGHGGATSSPYFRKRQSQLPFRISEMEKAILTRDFEKLGELTEEEAVDMHVIAMTSRPPIFYWNEGTMQVINKLIAWRKEGLLGYFTMDAGPSVHVITQAKDAEEMKKRLDKLSLVEYTIENRVAEGTKVIK